MAKKFYISDTHFGHKNILKFDERPFFTVEEMEQEMVKIWNERVTDNDTVYILGDFCWSGNVDEWKRILDMLNGEKVLVRGNHDFAKHHFKDKDILADGLDGRFEQVVDYLETDDHIDGQTYRVMMCHYPMPFYRSSWNPKHIMLYGHVHTTEEDMELFSLKRKLQENLDFLEQVGEDRMLNSRNKAQFFNVGCMLPVMGYGPQTLDKIVEGKLWKPKQNSLQWGILNSSPSDE